jgi:hypothetical protein
MGLLDRDIVTARTANAPKPSRLLADPIFRQANTTNTEVRPYTPPTSGGTYVAPSPTAPTSPTPAPAPAPAAPVEETPAAINTDALKEILAGIEAQFGLSREQLLSGEGEASNLYRFILANMAAAETQAQQGVENQAVGRGILRSGIAAQNQARVANTFAQQKAQAASQKDQQLAQIALALQQLELELGQERTGAVTEFGQDTLATDEQLADLLELV